MIRLPSFSTVVPTAAGVAFFWIGGEPAQAFFPPITAGNGTVVTLPPPVTVLPPPVTISPPPPPPFVSPPPPPVISPPPPTVVPQGNPDPPPTVTPQATPEPGTIVSGLIGLTLAGGAAWRRKRGAAEGK